LSKDPGTQWYYDYFNDVDTMQIEKLAAWLNDDVIVRFGNQPLLRGKPAALSAISEFWKAFKGLHHAHGQVLSSGDYTSGEAVVTFTLHDDRKIAIPGVSVLERRNGLVSRLSGYLDFMPLYAPPGAGAVSEPDFFLARI
jgi:hypothetical protein